MSLTLIDLNSGDPWEEFNVFVCFAQVSSLSGMIDGYFDLKVPIYFGSFAIYILNNIVGALPWVVPYGIDEILVMQQQAKGNFRMV